MIVEIDDLCFDLYSPSQLAAVRPDIERLASIMRRNLRHLDGILGVEPDHHSSAREHDRLRRDLHEARALADALRDDLHYAQERINTLENRLAAFEDNEMDALYASVGLVVTAHEVVVNAARRALLSHLHPDLVSSERKAAATVKFQKVNDAFDRIGAARRR